MLDSAVVSTVLLYAAPVLIVGFATRKGWLVMLTAVLVAVLGLTIGDPRYLLADLAAVLVVLVAALLSGRRRRSVRRGGDSAASAEAGAHRDTARWSWLWDVIGVLIVGWILFQTWKIDPPPAASGAETQRSLRKQVGADTVRPDDAGSSRVRALGLPREGDLRHCLEQGSTDAIRACAERG